MFPCPEVMLVVNGWVVGGLVKLADTVTGLLGIVNVQELFEDSAEHEVPVTFQPESVHPGEGVAVTLTCEPTCSWLPNG
jgi:hypothetical protein